MRQIESGTYIRDMARLERKAARTGLEVPDELLAKMPKLMRERILKGREQAAARVHRSEARERELRESGKVRNATPGNVHQLDEADLLEDLDLDSIFSSMTGGESSFGQAPAPTHTPPPSGRQARRRNEDDTDVDELFAGAVAPGALSGGSVATPIPDSALPASPRRPARAARRPPPSRPAAPGVKPPPGMTVSESQALYKRYKKARELVGENTSNLSYDKLMKSLNKQAPKILEQHKAQGVSFNVVVKGNRVVLKAKPKK